MGSYTVCVALTWMVTTILLCSQAAPVTEFFGPPQTIEGDSNVIYPDTDQPKKVQEMERFHRTYQNGTVEFKTALSNGHVQYQRISTKIVDGDKVQVYEGYISEQYKDGRYGTRYYAADENGYRSSSVIIENQPPQLPQSGPYSSSLPRDIQNELSPAHDDDSQTKPKALIDNLIEFEKDLEEILIATTDSEILKHQEQDEVLQNKSTEEPSLVQNLNAVQTVLPINLDPPSSTEHPSIENNYGKGSEGSESSTLSASGYNSNVDVTVGSSTELPINELNNDADIFDESSSLPTLTTIQSSEEELTGRNLHSSTTSEISSVIGGVVQVSSEEGIEILTNDEKSTEHLIEEVTTETLLNEEVESKSNNQPIDKIPEAIPTETLLNDEVISTEQPTPLDSEVHEPNTGVPEKQEVKTDGETSRVSTYPLEDTESASTSTTISPVDVVSNNSEEITKDITEQPSLEVIEDRSTESIASVDIESNSDHSTSSPAPEIDDKSRAINEASNSEEPLVSIPNLEINAQKSSDEEANISGTFLNDEVTSTEQPAVFNIEAQEPNTGVPELTELKTHAETSEISGYPLEDAGSETTTLSTVDNISKSSAEEEVRTEKTLVKNSEDGSTERISPENESSADLSTTSPAPEIENKSTEIGVFPTEKANKIELSTDLPLEDSKDVINESQDTEISSEKKGRSLDLSTELPLAENNSTATVEGSGSEEGQNISDASISTEAKEETTDKIDVSTELPESNEEVSTLINTASGENKSLDATTEAELISTTQKTDHEAGSSESSHDNTTDQDSQISTDQPLVVTSSEENSNEENKEKSTEDQPLVVTSSEENSNEENKEKSTKDEASTELPDQSSEEIESKATIVEITTEAENVSSTEETEEKTYGVEVELTLPVSHF